MDVLLKGFFWFFAFVVFYGYLGYGVVVYVLVKIKRIFKVQPHITIDPVYEPTVTLLIAAYNEADYIEEKIKNCFLLDYPEDKLDILFVTDGSDDGTEELIAKYSRVRYLHQPLRAGKIAAVKRAMNYVSSEITVFCDANTYLNPQAIRHLVRHFSDPIVGCVAGEKRIASKESDTASGAGEGLYWKYESFLKKMDSELYTVVGAAGELFAIRTELFESPPPTAIIEDFMLSLRIAQKGYTVRYEPDAYAVETSSANVKEELKRKVRICAGGIQSIVWLKDLLNPFRYGWLTFQYVSHRVLRWSLIPLFLALLFPLTIYLTVTFGGIYVLFLVGQVVFYLAAAWGWYLQNKAIKNKVFFVPYYFFIMNYAVFAGFVRYVRGRQQVTWERAVRSK